MCLYLPLKITFHLFIFVAKIDTFIEKGRVAFIMQLLDVAGV